MLLLPDQTYEEEYLFEKKKNAQFTESFPEHFYRRRRHKLQDDVQSVTSFCEELLIQYGARKEFFCKYRNGALGARTLSKGRSKYFQNFYFIDR